MPVMLIGDSDLPEEAYAGMVGQLTPRLRAANGFICHAGGPNPAGGWRVVEIWESEQDGRNWYDNHVKPNLPPGVQPRQTYYALHNVITKQASERPRIGMCPLLVNAQKRLRSRRPSSPSESYRKVQDLAGEARCRGLPAAERRDAQDTAPFTRSFAATKYPAREDGRSASP